MLSLAFVALILAVAPAPDSTQPPAAAPTTLTGSDLNIFQQSYADHRLKTAGWTGNFHQEARSPDLLAPITSDGNLTYRAPATLEMNYSAPIEGQVWIRNNDVGQKFSGRAPQIAAAPMVRSLLEFFRQPPESWQKDFNLTVLHDKDLVRIQLTVKPSAASSQPSSVTVEVNALTFDPISLEIVFGGQASLSFSFTDWKSLGPPSAIAPEPPANEPTPAPSRPRLPSGK